MPFHQPIYHTSRRRALREAERMPVNGIGVLVETRGRQRWAIYHDRPAPDAYRAEPCAGTVGRSQYGTLAHILTCIGLFDGPGG